MMEQSRPSVFDYLDYREFLRESYLHRKTSDRKFSHRFISTHVKASSSGWFGGILNGSTQLTRTFLAPLATLFSLNENEYDHFELLVNYSQSTVISERNRLLKKIVTAKGEGVPLIRKEQFDFFSCWYIPAIRELLFVVPFKGDYKTLGAMLTPKISPEDAKHAIEVLQNLNMISKNSQGRYLPNEETLRKDSRFTSAYWSLYMQTHLDLAKSATESMSVTERDISSVTVSYSDEGYDKASKKIRDLRRELLRISEEDAQKNRVYHCNVQLFPLSKKEKSC